MVEFGGAEPDGVEPEALGPGDPSGVDSGADAVGPRRRDRGWPNQRTLLLYLVGGLLIAAIPVVVARFVDQPPGDTYTIDIPPGTAAAIAAGNDVNVIPDELDLTLRDVLIIVNRDSVAHTIGPFEIGPGEQSEHSFNEVAAISAYCSLHPSGSISISIGE
ncbi:cupredoxin domain-containing protein [Candidatus Poriferisodalis sp.]|uniref:cupredoxin domain-containing protein n=1 Tax=Candidatus Poriferisodalis sp. TaxID=3101277 RepID=UPI003B0293E3